MKYGQIQGIKPEIVLDKDPTKVTKQVERLLNEQSQENSEDKEEIDEK
jgi:DNA-directed RNA polymerase beta' subunit